MGSNAKMIAGGIMLVIGLGLVLRFGGSSNALFKDFNSGVVGETNALALTGFPGNNP